MWRDSEELRAIFHNALVDREDFPAAVEAADAYALDLVEELTKAFIQAFEDEEMVTAEGRAAFACYAQIVGSKKEAARRSVMSIIENGGPSKPPTPATDQVIRQWLAADEGREQVALLHQLLTERRDIAVTDEDMYGVPWPILTRYVIDSVGTGPVVVLNALDGKRMAEDFRRLSAA